MADNTPVNIASITLSIDVYNSGGDYDEVDYDEVKKCLLSSATNKGDDALHVTLSHFYDVIFGEESCLDDEEKHSLIPTLSKIDSWELLESLCNPHDITWKLLRTHTLGSDIAIGVECSGTVAFGLEVPAGIDSLTFIKEFNAVFGFYSNNYVEWGWMDMGYILDVCVTATQLD